MSGDVLLANDGSTDLQDNTVGTGEVVDNSLESADIKDGTIATADLGDDSVTPRKVSFVADDIVPLDGQFMVGNTARGEFVAQTMSGDVLLANDGSTDLQDNTPSGRVKWSTTVLSPLISKMAPSRPPT